MPIMTSSHDAVAIPLTIWICTAVHDQNCYEHLHSLPKAKGQAAAATGEETPHGGRARVLQAAEAELAAAALSRALLALNLCCVLPTGDAVLARAAASARCVSNARPLCMYSSIIVSTA